MKLVKQSPEASVYTEYVYTPKGDLMQPPILRLLFGDIIFTHFFSFQGLNIFPNFFFRTISTSLIDFKIIFAFL